MVSMYSHNFMKLASELSQWC